MWLRVILDAIAGCFSKPIEAETKRVDISQTTFSNGFSWTKMYVFQLEFHGKLFLAVQLRMFQHWLGWWLGAVQALSHYQNVWRLDHRCIYASLGRNELAGTLWWVKNIESFSDNIFQSIFPNSKYCILIKISLNVALLVQLTEGLMGCQAPARLKYAKVYLNRERIDSQQSDLTAVRAHINARVAYVFFIEVLALNIKDKFHVYISLSIFKWKSEGVYIDSSTIRLIYLSKQYGLVT